MIRRFHASLLCAVAIFSACPTVLAADEWKDEPIRETLLLPVRGAAVGASLVVTAPIQAINGGCRAVNSIVPERTADVEFLNIVAAPAVFIGGALLAPIQAAPACMERSWNKPFSSESFNTAE